MAILKIRDAEGNVQEIVAIKGNDYVLTDEDKQEIAELCGVTEGEVRSIAEEIVEAHNASCLSREEIIELIEAKMPTMVSELENDSGYVTESNVSNYVSNNTLSESQVVAIVSDVSLGEAAIAEIARANTLSESQVLQLIQANTISEARVLELIQANIPASGDEVDY